MSVILSETIVPKAQNVDLFINLAKASDLKISPIRNQVMVLTNQPSKINRENIKVEGKVEGEININGLLHIHSSGSVNGKVFYKIILIDEGGKLLGEINYRDKNNKQEEFKDWKAFAIGNERRENFNFQHNNFRSVDFPIWMGNHSNCILLNIRGCENNIQ